MEELSVAMPGAKVVHIIRDGRDAAVSHIHHIWSRSADRGGKHELRLEEIEKRERYYEDHQKFLERGEGLFSEARLRRFASNWRLRVSSAMEDGRTLLGSNYIEVQYEELLKRPREEVAGIARFLGADTSEEAVERAVGSTNFEKMSKGRKPGEEDSRSFFRKGIAGDWKNTFTDSEKQIFKEEAGDLLVKLGYEKDYEW